METKTTNWDDAIRGKSIMQEIEEIRDSIMDKKLCINGVITRIAKTEDSETFNVLGQKVILTRDDTLNDIYTKFRSASNTAALKASAKNLNDALTNASQRISKAFAPMREYQIGFVNRLNEDIRISHKEPTNVRRLPGSFKHRSRK